MKNFRKVLALVLVVATLFSFAAMASAKTLADYKDADKVTTENYEVAIDVLSALEILDGYEDETFKPTNTITRAEMAKMIAVLANAGDADVDKLYAAACNFADVDKVNDWFASYVSYCAYTGIVSGRSADTFDPYGKVTGIETAKMLLVTMGFSADEQGYKGANWKLNVLRDAQNFGLLEGFAAGYDVDAAITREEAANMMLNALKAPVVVGVVSENIVKITNALYAERGMFATLIDAEKYGWVRMYGNVIVSNSKLGVELYGGRLDIDRVSDCYGRPGTQWTLKNRKGTVVFEGKFVADPIVATDYTGKIDLVDVLSEEFKLGNYKLDAFIDGKNVIDLGSYNGTEDKALVKGLANEIGRGVLVEVYVNDALKQITIVIINTYFGEVTAVLKSSDTFEVNEGRCFSNKAYGFEEGDYILYWLCGKNAADLHDAKVIEPTTAAITRAEKDNLDEADSTFTAGGKVYEYAMRYYNLFVNDFQVGLSKNEGATWDIYTDLYGYVVDVVLHEEADELFYAYVVENSGEYETTTQNGDGSWNYKAVKTFVDFDAKTNENTPVIAAAFANNDIWFSTLNDAAIDLQGKLVEYTVDEDGRANRARYAEVLDETGAVLTADGDLAIVDKDGEVENIVAYGNDDTKYLVRTWNYDTEAYEYNAYTEDTLPTGYAGYVNAKFGPHLYPVATIQYFDTDAGTTYKKANVATYVFIDVLYSLDAQRALILDHYKSVTDAKFINRIGACDYYEAVVNGTAGYVILNESQRIAFKVEKDAPILVEAQFEVVGLMDGGLPVYALAEIQKPTNFGPVEFVGGELIIDNTSVEIADGFYAVVVDPAGEPHIYTDAAALNDYVETWAAKFHAEICEKTSDDDCVCFTYEWVKSWIYENSNGVYEMYVVLENACYDDCEDDTAYEFKTLD